MKNNFWSCDCKAQEFQDWLRSADYQEILDRDEVKCNYPRDLRGQPIASLEEDQLSCEPKECPETCLCGNLKFVK